MNFAVKTPTCLSQAWLTDELGFDEKPGRHVMNRRAGIVGFQGIVARSQQLPAGDLEVCQWYRSKDAQLVRVAHEGPRVVVWRAGRGRACVGGWRKKEMRFGLGVPAAKVGTYYCCRRSEGAEQVV